MSSRHDWVIWLLFVSGLALIWAFAVLPVFNAVWLSLHTASSFIGTPHWAGLSNYVSLLSDPDFWRATENGFIYAGLCIVLQVVIGIVFALVLNTAFPLRWMVRGMAVLPYLLPTVVVALIFQWMTDGSFGVRYLATGERMAWGNAVVGIRNPLAPPVMNIRFGPIALPLGAPSWRRQVRGRT